MCKPAHRYAQTLLGTAARARGAKRGGGAPLPPPTFSSEYTNSVLLSTHDKQKRDSVENVAFCDPTHFDSLAIAGGHKAILLFFFLFLFHLTISSKTTLPRQIQLFREDLWLAARRHGSPAKNISEPLHWGFLFAQSEKKSRCQSVGAKVRRKMSAMPRARCFYATLRSAGRR